MRLALARLAFAITRARWASELIAEARLERRFRALAAAHIANGGCVVTRQSAGLTAITLEG